ncbi:cytochrome P450 94C1 [Ricinus communis]|uniref:Cytochrome P450, putative n=1 Tax=Ricinus communis TaxID=3988 RepID=B9T5M5_RICCO|nr:cytochrome P450 94C1 [Ricinus communis]EEF28834.1 cytochrome P450, putative [Ricinus communis]|eukprot:XP_002533544.1 cytochrome P450 94C1 [Ricinus communis]
MELEASWFLQSLHAVLFFVLLAIIGSCLFSLLFYSLRLKLRCNCEICEAYLTLSWTKQFNNLCDWYAHLLKSSPTKTIHIHVLGNTITANPENVEYMLKTRFDNYPKGKPFSTILGNFLGRGIFNVDGDSWRFQKKMASLELDRFSIRMYAFEIVLYEIEHRLVPLLSSVSGNEGGVLDLQDVFRRFSFDSICRFSFGLDPRCLEPTLPISEFAVAFDLASKLSAERAMVVSPLVWKIKRKLNLGSEKKMKEAMTVINILAQEVIRQKRIMGFLSHKDLLSRFMQTVNDETYLRDIVISFLLAGRDTVASALTSLFWLLANHPEVSSAILLEADRVLGPNQELTSYEQMKDLHYLQATVYESMRLYPPIQFDSKFCQEDDTLPDGTFVNRGTRVTYHPYAMGRMEDLWGQDCLEFKPERWLRNGTFFNENPFKYPVFQAGLRVCLGKEMALLELKSVAISLLRKFHIELETSYRTPRFSPGLTATFSGGLPVVVRSSKVNP